MPEAPTANMFLVLPTEDGDADLWDLYLNAALNLIDQHDHTPGKGPRIPSGALRIDNDVSWSSGGVSYSIVDAKAVDFTPQSAASVTPYSSALFVNASDSNLYFRNSLGANVQITAGSTLNVSIVGGIGGDYASVGALEDYDDATDTYRFRQQVASSVRQYAKVATADIALREYIAAGGAVVPTNTVTLKSPSGLGATYSITMPTALPGSTQVIQMTAAGALSASNTIAEDVTLASGKNIALQGSGVVKHGSLVLTLGAGVGHPAGSGPTPTSGGAGWSLDGTTSAVLYAVPLTVGDRITAWTVRVNKTTSNARTLTAVLQKVGTAGTLSSVGSSATNNGNASGFADMSVSGLTATIAADESYVLSIRGDTTAAGDSTYTVQITYDRP